MRARDSILIGARCCICPQQKPCNSLPPHTSTPVAKRVVTQQPQHRNVIPSCTRRALHRAQRRQLPCDPSTAASRASLSRPVAGHRRRQAVPHGRQRTHRYSCSRRQVPHRKVVSHVSISPPPPFSLSNALNMNRILLNRGDGFTVGPTVNACTKVADVCARDA